MNVSSIKRSGYLIALSLFLLPFSVQAEEQTVERFIIVGVDFSLSTAGDINNYWNDIKLVTGCSPDVNIRDNNICNKISPDDKIIIFKINSTTLNKMDIIGDIFLPKKPLLENESKYRLKMVPLKKSFRDSIAKAFNNPQDARSTEILAGIRMAETYFRGSNAGKKILILLSDMMESSRNSYDFEHRPINPEAIINNEIKNNRMPNLSGIKIYVSGASAPTSRKYDEVRKFWSAYFRTSKATFDDGQYLPRMVNFKD